jgi:hypothetical protein
MVPAMKTVALFLGVICTLMLAGCACSSTACKPIPAPAPAKAQ